MAPEAAVADPFAPPASDHAAPPDVPRLPIADSPADPLDVARAVGRDLVAHPGGYLANGLAYLALTTVEVVLALLPLGLGVAPAALGADEGWIMLGFLIGTPLYVLGIAVLVVLVVPLQMAGTMRALAAQAQGAGRVGAGSLVFGTREGAGRVLGFYASMQAAVFVGSLLLYLPGLLALLLGQIGFPLVVLERRTSVGEAYRLAWGHLREHLGWHIVVWLSALAVLVVLELTLVGVVVAFPVMCAWQVHAYRLSGLAQRR